MIESYKEFLERVETGVSPYQLAIDIQRELGVFYDEHWFELPLKIRANFKDMWDSVYGFFQGDDDENDLDNWSEAYRVVKYYLENLQKIHEMTPFDIAQREIINQLPRNASKWAYAILDGDISPEDCYRIPDHVTLLPAQKIEIEKRKLEYEKFRIIAKDRSDCARFKMQMNKSSSPTTASQD